MTMHVALSFVVLAAAAGAARAQSANPFDPASAGTGRNPLEAATAGGNSAAAAPGAPIRLTVRTLIDRGMNNMPSHTILAPPDWKVEGGGWWLPQALFKVLPSQDVTVTALDGRMVRIGPTLGAIDYQPSPSAVQRSHSQRAPEGVANDGLLVVYVPESLDAWRTFIETRLVRSNYPGATNIAVDPVVIEPTFDEIKQRQLAPIRAQQAAQNAQRGSASAMSVVGHVYSTTAHYDLDGKRWDHLYLWSCTSIETRAQVGMERRWSIEPSISFRAEAGQLGAQMPLLMAIGDSLTTTLAWSQIKADHVAKMMGIEARGAIERMHIISDAADYARQTINNVDANRRGAQDQAATQFSQYLRGVDNFAPAAGSNVPAAELPHNYRHVFGNAQGEYLLTNDANYDPNRDPAVNGKSRETMQPAR